MIEPLDALAFSMHNAKGVYAVLLGSGVSRAAEIPTGWEIILDLVRKLATLQGKDPEPDPEKWFQTTYGEPPSYSVLLDKLGKTPAERQAVLKSYIEPTDEDRSLGKKSPTKAHTAIAELAALGRIRVILTTNFDRLTESALEAAGVSHQVVATADAVAGMTPLAHANVTVVKLHGDYLDTRIKNTVAELEVYDASLNRLLDQILDEYGLVVCGWSAAWDTALRAAIERCPNRRYAMYWADFRHPTGLAAELIRHRAGFVIPNVDADTFFTKLLERVQALEEFSRPHPLSTAAAVAALKRYMPNPLHRIRLGEMGLTEADKVLQWIRQTHSSESTSTFLDMATRAQRIESMSETVVALVATGCYWGNGEHDKLWKGIIERLALAGEVSHTGRYFLDYEQLRLYPSLLCLYAGGIAALAARNYQTLRALLYDIEVVDRDSQRVNGTHVLDPCNVVSKDVAKRFPGHENKHTPASERILEILKPTFAPLMASDKEFERAFDRFEFLRSLVAQEFGFEPYPARFWYQYNHGRSGHIISELDAEVAKFGNEWPLFRVGMFGGRQERFLAAREKLLARVKQSGLGWR
jgi:hypothetical protein